MRVAEPEIGQDTENLAAKALRPPMRLSAEDLVASELASAALSEPLSKIRHVCEALMLLDDDEREQADITEAEIKETEKFYKLVIAFQNVYIDQFVGSAGEKIDRSATLQWPFSEKEAEEWAEWLEIPGIVLNRYRTDTSDTEFMEELKKMPEGAKRTFLYVQGRKLMPDTVFCFKTHFVIRAMPKIVVLMKKIMQLVSPDTYKQALKILRRSRREKT